MLTLRNGSTGRSGHAASAAPWLGAAIVGTALVYAAGLPALVSHGLGLAPVTRVLITIVILAPIALVLGMAYPLGIRILREHDERLVPWAWGLNGATSVVASVSSVFVGAQAGFTWALLMGTATYAIGFFILTLTVSARRIAAPERMSAAGGR